MRESLHKRQKTSEEAEVEVREAEIQRLRGEGRQKREQEQSKRAEAGMNPIASESCCSDSLRTQMRSIM
jgi:hypothetical protein